METNLKRSPSWKYPDTIIQLNLTSGLSNRKCSPKATWSFVFVQVSACLALLYLGTRWRYNCAEWFLQAEIICLDARVLYAHGFEVCPWVLTCEKYFLNNCWLWDRANIWFRCVRTSKPQEKFAPIALIFGCTIKPRKTSPTFTKEKSRK